MQAAIFQSSMAGLMPVERIERLNKVAEDTGADLLLCPELFLSGYAVGKNIRKYAETADGEFATSVARIARKTDTAIVYGYPEIEGDVLYNSAQCIDANGLSLANHRKLILPPGFETDTFTAGSEVTLFELNGLKCGLLICYDVEFPEAVRATAEAGAQIILAPTALGTQWSVVANRVIPARAFENGIYLLYANHCGEEAGITYLGASCIVGPDGSDLIRAGAAEEVITADIDHTCISAARERLPYHHDLQALRLRLT